MESADSDESYSDKSNTDDSLLDSDSDLELAMLDEELNQRAPRQVNINKNLKELFFHIRTLH